MMPVQIVEWAPNYNTYLEEDENRIVGKLFRDLIKFEGEMFDDKLIKSMQRTIDMARKDAKHIGSDGKFLDAFIKRARLGIGGYNEMQPISHFIY